MFSKSFLRNKSFAIDLGNNNTLLTDKEHILFSQPSCIVFDAENNTVKAIGEEAYNILEKNHRQLKPVKPMIRGVIADYESASRMLKEMVAKTFTKSARIIGFDHIISGVPFSTTEVERRALHDILEQFNARKSHLLFEPLAAAMGMGLNIQEPNGKMIVDIGGGITEIVIISLSGIAMFESNNVAGDAFNIVIQDYFRKEHGMIIGLKTAETIKIQIGSATQDLVNSPPPFLVCGKGLQEGIPVMRMTTHHEIATILERSILSIEESIVQTLELCPPELAADIYTNGIHLTGGSSLLRGLAERLQSSLQLPIHRDPHALLSVTKGISKVLGYPEKFKSILI